MITLGCIETETCCSWAETTNQNLLPDTMHAYKPSTPESMKLVKAVRVLPLCDAKWKFRSEACQIDAARLHRMARLHGPSDIGVHVSLSVAGFQQTDENTSTR